MKTIRSTLQTQALASLVGASPAVGVPFRTLEVLVAEIKAALPDEDEQKSCMLYGSQHLRLEYDNNLTPTEELTLRVQELEQVQREVRGLLPREGEQLRPEELARLRQLLG